MAMRVWLVWTGAYSDKNVRYVCSTPEQAKKTAELLGDRHDAYVDPEEGIEVDGANAAIADGMKRWRIYIAIDDGSIRDEPYLDSLGTGEPVDTHAMDLWFFDEGRGRQVRSLVVECDGVNAAHAVKIAADERRKYLATQIPT